MFNKKMSKLDLFTPESGKTGSRRNDKIASQIRECFSTALSRSDFPPVKYEDGSIVTSAPSPITITYVDVFPDLRNVKVYVMPLGGIKKEETLKFLTSQVHYFKNIIATKMKMRFIPDIIFKIDESLEYSTRIEEILKKI